MPSAEAKLRDLARVLARLGVPPSEVDDAVLEYFASVLEEFDADTAADTLAGFLPHLADVRPETLRAELAAWQRGAAAPSAPAPAPAAQPARPPRRADPAPQRAAATATASTPSAPRMTPELAMLREMAPQVPLTLLQHVLTAVANGDVQAAAVYLLEHDVVAEEAARQEQLRREAEAEAERARREAEARSAVLSKFSEQAVPEAEAQPVLLINGRRADTAEAKRAKKQRQQAVRYRDNMVVSTKGERFIQVKGKEEDPSTFISLKIKTKGKRGKGFR